MSFVLTTEQRSQCETVALSFPSYFVETQINNQTYKQKNRQQQADISYRRRKMIHRNNANIDVLVNCILLYRFHP